MWCERDRARGELENVMVVFTSQKQGERERLFWNEL
jgi:hypothetical protein